MEPCILVLWPSSSLLDHAFGPEVRVEVRLALEHAALGLHVVLPVGPCVDPSIVPELLQAPPDGPDGLHPDLLGGLPRVLLALPRALAATAPLGLLGLAVVGPAPGHARPLLRGHGPGRYERPDIGPRDRVGDVLGLVRVYPDPVLAALEQLRGHTLLVLEIHGHPLLLRTLILSSSAFASIASLFFIPTWWATLAASISGLILARSLTLCTMTSLNPDGCRYLAPFGEPYPIETTLRL